MDDVCSLPGPGSAGGVPLYLVSLRFGVPSRAPHQGGKPCPFAGLRRFPGAYCLPFALPTRESRRQWLPPFHPRTGTPPEDRATIPPTMAQVVSRSPSPLTVRHMASSKLARLCAALQMQKGTVSCAETLFPVPSLRAAPITSSAGISREASIPWRVAPEGVKRDTSRTNAMPCGRLSPAAMAAAAANGHGAGLPFRVPVCHHGGKVCFPEPRDPGLHRNSRRWARRASPPPLP